MPTPAALIVNTATMSLRARRGFVAAAAGGLVELAAGAAATAVAGAITPGPGGVGPMTIAMLLSNTLRSASRS